MRSHQGALGVDPSRFQNTRALSSPFRAVLLHLAVRALLYIDRQRDKDASQPSQGCIPCPAGALPSLLASHKLPLVLEPYPFPWAGVASLDKPWAGCSVLEEVQEVVY